MDFHPAPFIAPLRAFAALAFAWQGDRVLVCDIRRRGWCIPSGRVEPDETSFEAAIREAKEEAGAELTGCQYIGCYRIQSRGEIRWADCFTARVLTLGEIGSKEESLGRRLVELKDLEAIYHLWNPLTEQVFKYSLEILQRA